MTVEVSAQTRLDYEPVQYGRAVWALRSSEGIAPQGAPTFTSKRAAVTWLAAWRLNPPKPEG